MTTDTTQLMKVLGQEVAQKQVHSFYLQYTPEGRDADGNGLLRIKIIGAEMNIEIGGVKIEYDSRALVQVGPLAGLFKALFEADFLVAVGANNRSAKIIAGYEEWRKAAAQDPQIQPLVDNMLNKDALGSFTHVDFLPNEPVRRGDKWSRRTVLDFGPIGSYRTDATYVYEGYCNSLDRIRVETTLSYEKPKGQGSLPYTIKSADLKSTAGAGEILFDARRGRLVSSTSNMALEGKLTIDVGGMETDVYLRQTQTARIRVTDQNPLAAPKGEQSPR